MTVGIHFLNVRQGWTVRSSTHFAHVGTWVLLLDQYLWIFDQVAASVLLNLLNIALTLFGAVVLSLLLIFHCLHF